VNRIKGLIVMQCRWEQFSKKVLPSPSTPQATKLSFPSMRYSPWASPAMAELKLSLKTTSPERLFLASGCLERGRF